MDEQTAIVEKVLKMIGYVPIGMVDLLHVLAHPDVINLTRAYLDACSKLDDEGIRR